MVPDDSYCIVSWNVNSLNLTEERTRVLRGLHRLRASVCFIQETHFRAHQVPKFHDRRFSRGFSILIGGGVLWTLKDTWSDWIFFVKGTIGPQQCLFATIYSPNSALEQALDKLQEFAGLGNNKLTVCWRKYTG